MIKIIRIEWKATKIKCDIWIQFYEFIVFLFVRVKKVTIIKISVISYDTYLLAIKYVNILTWGYKYGKLTTKRMGYTWNNF